MIEASLTEAISPASASSTRWHGFDLLRLASYVAIISYHFFLMHFGTPTVPYRDVSIVLRIGEIFARSLSFSGFTIALLSSLLFGMSSQSGDGKLPRLFMVLAAGWIVLSIVAPSSFFLSWDIFGVLTLGFAAIATLRQTRRGSMLLGLGGYVLLWLPVWQLAPLMPDGYLDLKNVLGVARCGGEEISEWPLLPWVGLVWFGHWLGAMVRQLQLDAPDRLRITKPELGLWLLLLAASLPQWGAYYHVRAGIGFSCDVYRQTPLAFWSHILWPLWILRLSLDPRVQVALARSRLAGAISDLAISRKFWLAYASGYLWCALLAYGLAAWEALAPDSFAQLELAACELIFLTLPMQSELLTRGCWRLGRRIAASWAGQRQPAATTTTTELLP